MKVPFTAANNWQEHPAVCQSVPWQPVPSSERHVIYEAQVGPEQWAIRLNDFPDEPLYTLLIAGEERLHFDDWPSFWGARPPSSTRTA